MAQVPPRTASQRLRRHGRRAPLSSDREGPEIENLIVIGASAGGIQALTLILESIPQDIPAAIVLILHQGAGSSFNWAATLGRLTHIPIVTVDKDELLREGSIYIPCPGMSLSFRRGSIHAEPAAPRTRLTTTINSMFTSAAKVFGDRVIGVILTGLLRDGTIGLRAVHDHGGLTLVQDPASAEYPDMPFNALKDLPVTFCLDLPEIGLALDLLARRTTHLETGVAVSMRLLKKRAQLLVRLIQQSGRNAESCTFLEEELLSLRQDLESIARLLRAAPLSGRPP